MLLYETMRDFATGSGIRYVCGIVLWYNIVNVNRLYKFAFKFLKVVAVVVAATGGLVILIILLETSSAKCFYRYCTYPTPEALMAAEPSAVKNIKTVELDGAIYTMLNMGPVGFLPSGSAYLVYDANGRLVDRTLDEGDDSRFQRKWGKCKSMTRLKSACDRNGSP